MAQLDLFGMQSFSFPRTIILLWMLLVSQQGIGKKDYTIGENKALKQAREWVDEGDRAYKKGDIETAIFMVRKAESSMLEWHDDALLFKCYYLLGSCFKKRTEFVLAEDYLHKALAISHTPGKHRAAILNLLGNINGYNGMVEKSVGYHRRSLAIRKVLNDSVGLAETYNNLADLHIRAGLADSAEHYLSQSWNFKKKSQTKGFYYLNRAKVFAMKSEYTQSERAIRKAISYFNRSRKNVLQKAYAFVQAAEIGIGQTRYEMAGYYLDSAKGISKEFDDKDLLYQILLQEQKVLEEKGVLKQALEKATEAAELREGILNEAKLRTIAELETVYEFEKLNRSLEKQREKIALNNLKIRNQRLQVFALILLLALIGTLALWVVRRSANNRNSKREKEQLLYELNHRVKNNLSSLAGALVIQKSNSRNDETRSALSDVLHRIDAISTIHEVLAYSSTVEEENPELALDQILKDLVERLVAGSIHRETVKADLTLDECSVDLKSSLPLAMIANELVTNALKYAFTGSEPHKLTIQLTKNTDHLTLVVRDSGAGMALENWKKSQTTGMVLIKELVKQLHGIAEFENDNGLVFTLKIRRGR